ncbi:RraA family protein, partial [Rhizobium ruizarguesonis]
IDLLLPCDILVISRVDRDDISCVGGGVAAAAKAKGAAGIVIDVPCTDVDEIISTGFPVWCRAASNWNIERAANLKLAVRGFGGDAATP